MHQMAVRAAAEIGLGYRDPTLLQCCDELGLILEPYEIGARQIPGRVERAVSGDPVRRRKEGAVVLRHLAGNQVWLVRAGIADGNVGLAALEVADVIGGDHIHDNARRG